MPDRPPRRVKTFNGDATTRNQKNRLNRKENLLIFGNPDSGTNCGLHTLLLMFCTAVLLVGRDVTPELRSAATASFAHPGAVNE